MCRVKIGRSAWVAFARVSLYALSSMARAWLRVVWVCVFIYHIIYHVRAKGNLAFHFRCEMLYDVSMATTNAQDAGPGTEHCVSIGELARRTNRRPATIRMWEHEGILPEALLGVRDGRRWRWWTEAQADAIVEIARGRYPGAALPNYRPSPEEVDEVLERMRSSKRTDEETLAA